jgi:hypothetical protein
VGGELFLCGIYFSSGNLDNSYSSCYPKREGHTYLITSHIGRVLQKTTFVSYIALKIEKKIFTGIGVNECCVVMII